MKNFFTPSPFILTTLVSLLVAATSPTWASDSDTPEDEPRITQVAGSDFEYDEEGKNRVQEPSFKRIRTLQSTKPTTEQTDKKILRILKSSELSEFRPAWGRQVTGHISLTQYGKILTTLAEGLKEEVESQKITYDFTASKSIIFSNIYRNELFKIITDVTTWMECSCLDVEKMRTILKYAPSNMAPFKTRYPEYYAEISRYKDLLTKNIFQ